MADQISNMADCVDLSMNPNSNNQSDLSDWSDDKKKRYLDKAISVCNACLIGTETCSQSEKQTLIRLNHLSQTVFQYAQFKIANKDYSNLEFFAELENANSCSLTQQNQIIGKYITKQPCPYSNERNYTHTKV